MCVCVWVNFCYICQRECKRFGGGIEISRTEEKSFGPATEQTQVCRRCLLQLQIVEINVISVGASYEEVTLVVKY